MKRVLAILITLLPLLAFAQVRVASSAKPEKKVIPYDSISNIPEDSHGFVGQEIFLLPKSEKLQSFGYFCFVNKDGGSMSSSVKYDLVAAHTFKVIDAIDVERYFDKKTILKLVDSEDGSIYYTEVKNRDVQWPFLTLGYKAKFEADNKGKKFHLLYVPPQDFNTGGDIQSRRGSVWTFQEIIAFEDIGGIGYIFSNAQGETIVLSSSTIKGSLVTTDVVDAYVKKCGQAMVDTALKGNIMVGMTKELVLLAWGEPDDINEASYGDQWVYGTTSIQCVYFKNGKVTSWN